MKATKQFRGRCGSIARIISGMSFLILAAIGVSSLVHAMTLSAIANKNGIPLSWDTASIGNTASITVPITYFDQRQDSCSDPNHQFEWTACGGYGPYLSLQQGIVSETLGSDGLPVPKYETSAAAKAGGIYPVSTNLTGHNPVQPTDNFYRWFHETTDASGKQLSKRIEREAVFTRTGESTYTFGGENFFPLNDETFSNGDPVNTKLGRNYHFTAHLQLPVKVDADGTERFDFVGDDDVWVFLNDQLVLDIGGYHGALKGWFNINNNGTITTYVEGAGTKVIPTNFQPGDVVNLDFFFAERSSTGSNCTITMANMNWPISAASDIDNSIAGKIESTESNLIQNLTSITNRDTANPMMIEKISAYIRETENITDIYDRVTTNTKEGFLPLSRETLFYTTTPDDAASWQPVDISAPSESADGFKLANPIRVAPAGTPGDTVYFRYFTETSEYSGSMNSQISYLTSINGAPGLTYDYNTIEYVSPKRNADVTAHKFNIDYIFEDGSAAAPTEVKILEPGEEYKIVPPAVDGFTPNVSEVEGVAGEVNTDFLIMYSPIDDGNGDGGNDDGNGNGSGDSDDENQGGKNPSTPENPETPDDSSYYAKVTYVYEDKSQARKSGVVLASQTDEESKPAQIAVSVNNNLKSGRSYNFISPRVNGYYPSRAAVSGTIAHDNVEETVVYSKTPTMLNPDTIVKPTPDAPVIPTTPSIDIIDEDLAYIAPLGEVAFVPNTGIIGDAVSALSSDFAVVIMSQGFVLGVLLVFAGSFAVYFSCRKDIKPAKSAVVANKVASSNAPAKKVKASSRKPVAKKVAKPAAKKTAKAVAKPAKRKAVKKTK